jgi:hypothetical protein
VGRVVTAARSFGLPFEVLVGRRSTIISDYKITKLPRIIIIGRSGRLVYSAKSASYSRLKTEVLRAMRHNL